MAEAEAEVEVVESAPAPEVAPAPAPEPAGPHDVALSPAQIQELWRSPSAEAGLALLARCLAMPEDYEEDLRSQIWLDLLYGVVDFCKGIELTPRKAKAYLNVMTALHATSIESKCGKEEAFGTFKDALLAATKSLPLAERFSLEEVRKLTDQQHRMLRRLEARLSRGGGGAVDSDFIRAAVNEGEDGVAGQPPQDNNSGDT